MNNLLLDTHVFLWWRANNPLLQEAAGSAIADAGVVFVSAATAWEAAIKSSLGRLKLPASVESGVEDSGFEKLPITFSHAEAAAALPPHHHDPFDRMLVAQAAAEGLTLVTHDRKLKDYDVPILWT
ncbi:MAG: type II toxin-antitoxin system VapC family toxin [Deltaproteobacteria bacterium]|nr:type II toxin-antitoxin system VapC family toxin [Deltaproteobacteria bacterium]